MTQPSLTADDPVELRLFRESIVRHAAAHVAEHGPRGPRRGYEGGSLAVPYRDWDDGPTTKYFAERVFSMLGTDLTVTATPHTARAAGKIVFTARKTEKQEPDDA